jgi:site-specific recombinase XerD
VEVDLAMTALEPPERTSAAVVVPVRDDWAAVVAAYLDLAERRTGSPRTVRAYGSAIRAYAAAIGDLGAATPATVALWAYAPGPSGRTPAAATIIVRLAALRGLYRYAGRVRVWHGPNPADEVDRPRQAQPIPKGLDASGLRRLLATIPPTTSGLRDRAIIITVALVGLRRAEVLGLRARDIATDGKAMTWTARTKGGQIRCRELPEPAWSAITAYLDAAGRPFATLDPDAPLFPISGQGFAANLDRYAGRAGLGHLTPHGLRHSAAKLRRATGASLEEVQSLLGHRTLATTSRYLARLEAETDSGWAAAAAAIGL